jgi:hypothetical protein
VAAEHSKMTVQRKYRRVEAQRINDFVKAKDETGVKFTSAETAPDPVRQRTCPGS